VDEAKKKRFLWGAALTWSVSLLFLANFASMFSNSKANGLTAVAGEMAEVFVEYGIAAVLIGQTAALVLLFRSFSKAHWLRSAFALLSISLSGLMLLLVAFFFWAIWFQSHRRF
jgi:hypothetical protein